VKKYELAEMQHHAQDWRIFRRWVIVPLIFLGVMILCGFIDGRPM